jgi:sugar/nucleoside kinase (ribokinase family)
MYVVVTLSIHSLLSAAPLLSGTTRWGGGKGRNVLHALAEVPGKTLFGFGVPDNFKAFTKATVLVIGDRDQEISYDRSRSSRATPHRKGRSLCC